MNQKAGLLGLGAALLLLAAVQGCSSNNSQTPAAQVSAQDRPKVVTDLSSLSSANPLNPFAINKAPVAKEISASAGPASTQGTVEATGTVRHTGDDRHPGEERLLNKKAAKYDMLSMRVMDQLFGTMQDLEDNEDFSRLKLPSHLRPVIITGTLDRNGKLRELVIEQHSGEARVDKMAIRACKKALYINNPPADAISGDGDYKVQVQARIQNFSTVDGKHWQFTTFLGIALL